MAKARSRVSPLPDLTEDPTQTTPEHQSDGGKSDEVRVLFVNDLHAGHEYGLWPEDFLLLDGAMRPLNDIQKRLLGHWNSLYVEARDDIKPDILIVNGDLLDGEQRKSGGKEAATAIEQAQVKAARRLLEPLVSLAKETYFIRGTPYHDGDRGLNIEPIAESLGGIGPVSGWHTWPLLDLRIREKVVINVQHAVSVAGGLYRLTPLDREGIWSALAGKEGKVPKADAVARAHAHIFAHGEHSTKHIFIVPCWQGQTEYMRRHSAYRMLPDIGAVALIIRPKEKDRDRDPITGFQKFLYPLPEVKAWDSLV